MKTIIMGPLLKITLWMHIKRIWCKHKNTFQQYVMAYLNKEDEFPVAPVVNFWQCHDCGVSWGEYLDDAPATWAMVTEQQRQPDIKIG